MVAQAGVVEVVGPEETEEWGEWEEHRYAMKWIVVFLCQQAAVVLSLKVGMEEMEQLVWLVGQVVEGQVVIHLPSIAIRWFLSLIQPLTSRLVLQEWEEQALEILGKKGSLPHFITASEIKWT